jgi:hypothetical protein
MAVIGDMATIAVSEDDGGFAWYERFFGRPPDQWPMNGLAGWHLHEGGAR